MGERCPHLPQALPAAFSTRSFTLGTASEVIAGFVVDRASTPKEHTMRRSLLNRSSFKRGPPFLFA
jgi:hypothetical protein